MVTNTVCSNGSLSDCYYQASEQMVKLYKVLIDNDATMVEVNPLTEDKNGQGNYSVSRYNVVDVLLV